MRTAHMALLALGTAACDEPEGSAWIKGAGWVNEDNTQIAGSLALDNADVAYHAYGLVNRGTLTPTGLERGDDVAMALLGQELGTTYCGGDCGGIEATLTIVRDGNEDSLTYPQTEPPLLLLDAHEYVMDVMNTLATCVESFDVQPAEGCMRMATR